MLKYRSFRLDKFIKATDDELLKQYFETWKLTVPDGLAFDGGDGFDEFWKGIVQDIRIEIEDQLHCINDIADSTRDYVQIAVKEFDIKTEKDEFSETTALRVFLHSKEAFDQYLYIVYSEKLRHHRFIKGTANLNDGVFDQVKADNNDSTSSYQRPCGATTSHCVCQGC